MNAAFGDRLRRELIDLMGRSEFLRSRTRSTGSQRLSIDSVETQIRKEHDLQNVETLLDETQL